MWPTFKEWRQVFRFGVFASFGLVLNEASQRLPEIIVGRILNVSATGYYSRGNSFITMFNQTTMDAIWPVASSSLAHMHREEQPLAEAYLRFVALVTGFAWPMLACLGLLAQPIILLLFGDQWLPSVPVAHALCLATAILLVGRINNATMNATGNVVPAFHSLAAAVPLQIGLLLLVTPKGIEYAAWAASAISLFFSLYSSHQALRLVDSGWARLLKTVFPSLLVTVVSIVPILAIDRFVQADDRTIYWTSFALKCPITVLAWFLALRVVHHPLRAEIATLWDYVRSDLSRRGRRATRGADQ